MKTAFVCDTGTGLSPKELETYGVYGVPLQITDGDITYLEEEEISVDEVYDRLKEGKMLKTSLASMEKTRELFKRLKEEGYKRIFAVPICSGLSGTINMMRIVADEVGLEYDYFDCHVTVMVERYMVVRAKELYEEGKTLEEIKAILNEVCDSANTLIIPDDLQHLKRGGRLTPFAATLGGLLKIKPILQINKATSGRIDVLDKVRTLSRAMARTVDTMKETITDEGENFCITVAHVVNEERGLELLNMYKEVFPKAEFHFIKLVSVVGVHTGLGTLALQYFKKR